MGNKPSNLNMHWFKFQRLGGHAGVSLLLPPCSGFVSRLKVFLVCVGYISDLSEKSCAEIYLQRSTWELIY